ncbi:TetR/AcrR family transcriptional regulator [Pusillimonas sp. ANT_WB101]|uniref:TetR/AcrR family transcriptional regulator n=1 Tax=Pusillimonas sp. ANT_WB101 TaxID=2597356 RepID=UPI0011EBB50B|nr:TetR/AcrR family transcriptional regulator [Pusillimonas sp. ANT_WB101]KAA0889419.1 TetR/AcrR family transcriptional regulator [Pusillimonas sp. ANT_WB101]
MIMRRSQDAFLKELTQLLIAEGISGLTIADMAARLKCSRRRIYEIAPSKEELFVKVCEQVFAASLEKSHAVARKEKNAAAAISAYLNATLNATGLSKPALIDLDRLEAGRAVFDAYQVARINGLELMIEEGVRQGVLVAHHPRLVSEAILGAAFRIRNQRFLSETGFTIGDAFTQFYDLILNGLLKKN